MISQRLKEIRKQRGITQEEAANFLEVKRQTYGAYERGVSMPDSPTLKKLADYFGVSIEFFFREGDEGSLTVQTPQEERLLILARRAEKIPPKQRERLIQAFEDNIDLYLEAMGVGEKKKKR